DTLDLINSPNELDYALINHENLHDDISSEGDVGDSDKIITKNTTASILRQRGLKSKSKESEDSGTTKSLKNKVNKNPLNWFGVLVPFTLRDSQKHFKQGLKKNFNNILNLIFIFC